MRGAVQYSMCWEDPKLVIEGLDIIAKDRVLSIASGGENVFAIAIKNPLQVIAVDANPMQIQLVKLKIAAIKTLAFEEFISFIGFKETRHRTQLFRRCAPQLTTGEITFWDAHLRWIEMGVAHCGRFEKYLSTFRKILLPAILSKEEIQRYIASPTLEDQSRFYREVWDGRLWRFLFSMFFSQPFLKLAGRDRSYFRHNTNKKVASHYFRRASAGITKIPIRDNHFMRYILTGNIPTPCSSHPYLDPGNFAALKRQVRKITCVQSDIVSFMQRQKDHSFSKFNLSDVFEMMTQEEYEYAIAEVSRIAACDARVCYWNNLVERSDHPSSISVVRDEGRSSRLQEHDRVFFYSRFILEKINQ